jgi:hypothetical protein
MVITVLLVLLRQAVEQAEDQVFLVVQLVEAV